MYRVPYPCFETKDTVCFMYSTLFYNESYSMFRVPYPCFETKPTVCIVYRTLVSKRKVQYTMLSMCCSLIQYALLTYVVLQLLQYTNSITVFSVEAEIDGGNVSPNLNESQSNDDVVINPETNILDTSGTVLFKIIFLKMNHC